VIFFNDDSVTLETPSVMGQIVSGLTAIYITADFPTLKGNDPCIITKAANDGTVESVRNFTVWRRLRIQDGALTEIFLKAA
jgi:hypothetical protein